MTGLYWPSKAYLDKQAAEEDAERVDAADIFNFLPADLQSEDEDMMDFCVAIVRKIRELA